MFISQNMLRKHYLNTVPALNDRHFYVSTYCQHARHDDCRDTCKVCSAPCLCPCHQEAQVKPRS